MSFEKIKPFDTNIEPTICNLATCRVILKFNNFVLVLKSSSSLYSNSILYFYMVYELNTWPCDPTNNFSLTIVYWYIQISNVWYNQK